jgi:hypothetical protein
MATRTCLTLLSLFLSSFMSASSTLFFNINTLSPITAIVAVITTFALATGENMIREEA